MDVHLAEGGWCAGGRVIGCAIAPAASLGAVGDMHRAFRFAPSGYARVASTLSIAPATSLKSAGLLAYRGLIWSTP